MFTIEQVKATHAKVKSGADFPAYIQDMKKLGVTAYTHYVTDGHTEYSGSGNYHVHGDAKWPAVAIAGTADIEALKHALTIHQQGQTDYLTFCRQSADAGVDNWVVDMAAMKCIYYDTAGKEIVAETIPGA